MDAEDIGGASDDQEVDSPEPKRPAHSQNVQQTQAGPAVTPAQNAQTAGADAAAKSSQPARPECRGTAAASCSVFTPAQAADPGKPLHPAGNAKTAAKAKSGPDASPARGNQQSKHGVVIKLPKNSSKGLSLDADGIEEIMSQVTEASTKQMAAAMAAMTAKEQEGAA